jgi:transcriptional regulator with XRE-family HTH domain
MGPDSLAGASITADMADNKNAKTPGELIREARAPKGSLRDFAKKLEITPSYLSDIENDRRVPAENVLRRIADLLGLEFDDLMAKSGRFGEDADRYMRRHPTLGVLFRRLSEWNLSDEDLAKLLKKAEELARKKGDGK